MSDCYKKHAIVCHTGGADLEKEIVGSAFFDT